MNQILNKLVEGIVKMGSQNYIQSSLNVIIQLLKELVKLIISFQKFYFKEYTEQTIHQEEVNLIQQTIKHFQIKVSPSLIKIRGIVLPDQHCDYQRFVIKIFSLLDQLQMKIRIRKRYQHYVFVKQYLKQLRVQLKQSKFSELPKKSVYFVLVTLSYIKNEFIFFQENRLNGNYSFKIIQIQSVIDKQQQSSQKPNSNISTKPIITPISKKKIKKTKSFIQSEQIKKTQHQEFVNLKKPQKKKLQKSRRKHVSIIQDANKEQKVNSRSVSLIKQYKKSNRKSLNQERPMSWKTLNNFNSRGEISPKTYIRKVIRLKHVQQKFSDGKILFGKEVFPIHQKIHLLKLKYHLSKIGIKNNYDFNF